MNDALETLVVDFQLRGYREAMAGIRAYTQAVKDAAKLLSTLNLQFPTIPKLPVGTPSPPSPSPSPNSSPNAKGIVPVRITSFSGSSLGQLINAIHIPTAGTFPTANPKKMPTGREVAAVRIAAFSPSAIGQLGASLRGQVYKSTSTNTTTGQFGGILRPLTVGTAAATASLLGFTRAGLSGTVEGYRLESQFTMLSRNIASVFLPAIDKFTERLQRLNFMLMRMDGGQQRKLMGAGLGVAGAGVAAGGLAALAPILGPVLGIFTGMIPVLGKLAIAGGPVTIALGLVASAMAVAAGVMVYFAVTNKSVRDSLLKVWESLTKVWEMSKELRVALYDIVESMVVNYFKNLAQAIKDIADALPGFIDDMKKLREEFKGKFQEAKDFAAPVAKPVNEAIVQGVLAPQIDALMGIKDAIDGNGLIMAARLIPKEPANPFKDKLIAERFKEDGPARRNVTPFQPGREDAMSAFNRFQDAAFKTENIPKAQLEQLILIAAGQQAIAFALQAAGAKADFNNRPAPNGRPRGG